MRICYILLSPTSGMHQYTADLANRMAQTGHDVPRTEPVEVRRTEPVEVHLVTTARYPRDRYLPAVTVHTPVDTRNTGFSADALRPAAIRNLQSAIRNLHPALVHFTGPHLWNVFLLRALRRAGIPVVHTLHDLDPHSGAIYGRLLHVWNGLVIRQAGHILVHGARYRERLLAQGVPPARVTCTPLLHLFLGHAWLDSVESLAADVCTEPWALFFGRLERYKGVAHLIAAWVGVMAVMMVADWFLPFVYNIGFPGFQASVLVWMFLGGLVTLETMDRGTRARGNEEMCLER